MLHPTAAPTGKLCVQVLIVSSAQGDPAGGAGVVHEQPPVDAWLVEHMLALWQQPNPLSLSVVL